MQTVGPETAFLPGSLAMLHFGSRFGQQSVTLQFKKKGKKAQPITTLISFSAPSNLLSSGEAAPAGDWSWEGCGLIIQVAASFFFFLPRRPGRG